MKIMETGSSRKKHKAQVYWHRCTIRLLLGQRSMGVGGQKVNTGLVQTQRHMVKHATEAHSVGGKKTRSKHHTWETHHM